MHQIEISDFTIDVVRKNIKNMHLSVYPPTGRVRIAAPLDIDDEAVRLFAISKLGVRLHSEIFLFRSVPLFQRSKWGEWFVCSYYVARESFPVFG